MCEVRAGAGHYGVWTRIRTATCGRECWQVKLQNERDQKYPNGWDIPVYESDGTTQIGTFHIGK